MGIQQKVYLTFGVHFVDNQYSISLN